MTRSLAERLRHAAPPPSVASLPDVETTVSDLERILALPTRPPVDCERDPKTGKFPPETQALMEIMTERLTRGPRVSCSCRERVVRKLPDGSLLISRTSMIDEVPESPKIVSLEAFAADMQRDNSADAAALMAVTTLAVGSECTLPSADGRNHKCIETLNPVQSWLLREAWMCDGVVGFCGVGSGKSIAFLLASLLFDDIRLAVLAIEPKQRRHYRSQYLRAREHFRVPSIVFDDGQPGYTVRGTAPLHLLSYSVLSQMRNSDLLDSKDPDVLLLDEAHRACGSSAINRRVKRYCADRIKRRHEAQLRGEPVPRRAIRLLDASGTMEAKSVEDTQMLCAYSLGTGSPLPLDPEEARRFSQVMDPQRDPDRTSHTARALQRSFAGYEFDENTVSIADGPEKAIREGFRKRRLWTPGIVSASASSINASIYITEREAPKMPPAVHEALVKVRTENLRPDNELLVERVEQVACARNVACGFYNYWAFPNHKCKCEAIGPRCESCRLIDDWYAKRKAYNKELRSMLMQGALQLDTPELCRQAAERFYQDPPYKGKLPLWDSLHFPAWRDIEDMVKHEKREAWIEPGGDFLANDAAAWASDNKGVVWLQSTAFGHRLSKLTGLPFYNGGPKAEERMAAEKGDRSIIVSIKAHGAGTDGLQYIFNKQLIVETPASNAKHSGYEQLLGRLHREGQRKDEVFVEGYFHVRELKDAFRQALMQAEWNVEMQKNRQKLLMADIDMEWV